MIYLNDFSAYTSVHYGDTSISKVYAGDNQVWPVQPPTPPSYENQYLTIVPSNKCEIYFNNYSSGGTLNYSIDEGSTWQVFGYSLSFKAGDRIMFKGDLKPSSSSPQGIGSLHTYTTGRAGYKVEGNAMSLLFGDNFIGQTDLTGYEFAFNGLFSNNYELFGIDNLKLPATTLSNGCYQTMFSTCSGLTSIPSDLLPATTIVDNCYNSMFASCSNITNSPVLPATTLIEACYFKMFRGCTNLNEITCLATNTNLLYTYEWLKGVSSTGTFIKNPSMTSWPTGDNGIPSGWTVVDYSS